MICVAGIDDLWANGSYWRNVWAFCGVAVGGFAFDNFVYKMGCNAL